MSHWIRQLTKCYELIKASSYRETSVNRWEYGASVHWRRSGALHHRVEGCVEQR